MKILNLMKILLLCVMTAGLASCGDDNYYTIQNSDEKLCSDSWVEEYDTEGGACRHILEFTKGKQGGKGSPFRKRDLYRNHYRQYENRYP